MEPTEREAELRPILSFLRGSLVPHAEAEERILYPAVAKLLGNPEATAPMISDRRAIPQQEVEAILRQMGEHGHHAHSPDGATELRGRRS